MSRPARPGGEFFTEPTDASQRRYEALRAYLYEGQPAEQVASRYGYTVAALHSAVRDFRAGQRNFFTPTRPGPMHAPAKDAARDRVLAPVPAHQRRHPQPWQRHHRPARPACLLARPAPSRHPHRHRPMVAESHTSLRVRLNWGPIS